MKPIFLIIFLLSALIVGCKKSSDPSPAPINQSGTGGLTKSQTVSLLMGNWKTANTITTNYYDANNNLISSQTDANSFPYWGITTIVFQGSTYYNIQASDNSGINPSSGGWSDATTLTLLNGVTTINAGGDTYVITTLNSTTLAVTHTTASLLYFVTISGVKNADQKLTFTKY